MHNQLRQGRVPLLVSMPHVGTDIPDDIAARLTARALERPDTDWHLIRLYDALDELGASVLSARWSRYVIDLNRPPEDSNLYPGLDTTGLVPVDTFDRAPLYRDGDVPGQAEVQRRLERYWSPYHNQLRAELDRLLSHHGRVVLWDAHSIASHVPRFFEGALPDLNFGTAQGASCAPEMAAAVIGPAQAQERYSVAVNGRFKGGHITRYYGRPALGVHAIQLEMSQRVYMDEASFAYLPERAAEVQGLLAAMTSAAAAWAAQ